jgi:DNA-binding NarL/FixJ family response regulator
VTGSRPIRVLIADDHPLFRAGVASVLGCHADMEVVGEAADGVQAVELAQSTSPDVVLMDLQMPQMSGLAAISAIRQTCPAVRILVVTTYGGDVQSARALRLGASGYLLKDALRTDLVDAIRKAVTTPQAGTAVTGDPPSAEPGQEPLSGRELEILAQIALARSNDDIARVLDLSPNVVKAGVRRILLKLNAQDRTHAVIIAIKRGIIVV